MTRHSSRKRRPSPSDRRNHFNSPHPSWFRAPAKAVAPLAPEDFWQRLGL